jgi:cysteinyl-tRNA synthetase
MMVDLINRTMISIMNLKTFLVMNITDIDNKIIKKAIEKNMDWKEIARIYEKSFFDSMAKLNVKLPNVIIRVTDSIPQIILYIQKIIDNGFAYVTTDGSVYFDSGAYVKQGYHFADLFDEDESIYQSELSPLILLQKRNKKDFALWKGRNSKEVGFNVEFIYNETIIKSWGAPGWHIECSAMINETIGPNVDIHFGGIDLKFPHHHNESLQAHAFYHPKFKPDPNYPPNNTHWVNEFMHIGHLCIKGSKMSKSLKNFTTIDEALQEISPNQLRWMFILHKWEDQMDYSDDTIAQAKAFDKVIMNFFNRVANYPFIRSSIVYIEKEFDLYDYFYASKNKIILELFVFKFNIAVSLLSELINRTNTYISIDNPNESLVRMIQEWIFCLTNNLGFIYQKSENDNSLVDVMNVLIGTRSAIRLLTRDKSISKETKQKLFEILDGERNTKLPEIGIMLQDTKESSSWFKN